MNVAKNYQGLVQNKNYPGRVPETYQFMENADESVVVSVSSSRVSEESESYNLVNSKSLLTNDKLLNTLSKGKNFKKNCNDKNISDDDQKLLKHNFDQYLKQYTELTEA